MEITFQKNNDEQMEKAYTKNLPLLKLQTHEEILPEDWQGLIAETPDGVDKLFWCIGCVGLFMVETEDKFDAWCAYCATVAKSAASACGVDASEELLCLMGCGLAARTFNFAAHPARQGERSTGVFVRLAEYECKTDVEYFSMWNLLVVLVELLRMENTDDVLHDMISCMTKMNKIRTSYRAAADLLPKQDAQ